MQGDPTDRVLTIEETKLRMRDIRDRAVHHDEVIRFGDRGRDEMVIVSSHLWEAVNARKQEDLALHRASASPFAAFSHLLRRPAADPGGSEPRRRMRGVRDTSDLPVLVMIGLAGEPSKPPRRRRNT